MSLSLTPGLRRPCSRYFASVASRLGKGTQWPSVWLALILATILPSRMLAAGAITRETFTGIGGTSLTDLTSSPNYPNSPSSRTQITDFFEAPTDVDENYGQRMHGYIVPPATGSYTFWIASDDQGALFLSTDETPAKARQICQVPEWTSSREWTKYAEQQSAPITLQANKAYYVSALMKEGGGGDNLAVRWLRPGGVDEAPIPATYLLPWGTVFTPPVISQQPANAAVVEGQIATFTVGIGGNGIADVKWQRNQTDIPGATGATLNFGPVAMTDHNAKFRAVLTNLLGTTTSSEATLTVTPDVTKPTLAGGINLGQTRIRLVFSEPVEAASATTSGNYQVSGGINVSTVAMDADPRVVILTVSGMTSGANYTVTVNNVRDRAATPNTIVAGSQISFLALELVSQDIGTTGGSIQRLSATAFDVTGAGATLGGTSDQLQFAWELRTGDFDMQVRVTDVSVSSAYLHAGLMARGTLDANSPFAAIFGSSAQAGCFFESRGSAGANSSQATLTGGYPVNYPYTWLRLRRAGNTFTGFASRDGQTWTQLGSASVTLPAQLYLGLAVSSLNTSLASTVKFREYGAVTSTAVGAFVNDRESLTPSSRRTGLLISEIMYEPKLPDGNTNNLEFVEIYNAGAIFEDLTGWRLTGAVEFAFPDGFKLQAGQFVVIAADPATLQTTYGILGVLGPFEGSLNNAGELLELRDSIGAIKLSVEYSPNPPWPVAADGAGHSLVLTAPSYGEADPRAWSASGRIGGSPGQLDPVVPDPADAVVINEFLAHTDDPQPDFIELYNHSNASVDLSGCYLTDDRDTNKFRIPEDTTLAARGFVSFNQNQLGFSLSAGGETIYLVSSNGLRVLDAVRFEGQENGVSSGRLPNGSGTIRRLAAPSPDAANAEWAADPIVINEIMFNPITGDDADEFIELHNRGTVTVNLADWRFESGVDFEFPAGASIAPGGFVVVAKDAARLRANYPQLNAGNTFGDYGGSLRNSGDRLALSKPDDVVTTNELGNLETNQIHIIVAEVAFADGGAWGKWADGGGSSLELVDPDADPLRGANWADSDESQKGAWTLVEFTGRLDNGHGNRSPDRLYLGLLNDGECLVDDVELVEGVGANLVTNPGFESATGWSFWGNHAGSSYQGTGAFAGARCLKIVADGGLDTGPNSIRVPLAAGLANNDTATVRARVRWLRGWPELLFRLRGNYLDFAAQLPVPKNLGTPGQANSRAIANAGPAIYDVTHSPALPRANQAVVVTARISDPDGVNAFNLRFRINPNTALTSVTMRDDGTLGDAIAGDGIYSATITGRSDGTLIAYRIEATDGAGSSTTFPKNVPTQECLVRWDDPVPAGTYPHVHLWVTDANRNSPGGNALNNRYRNGTLVYGHRRVIYNVNFRDKGSPYHGGAGDIAAVMPEDDPLHGVREHLFAQTGNGGSEPTGLRSRLAGWLGKELGIPYLHGNFMRFYINAGEYANIVEDLEEPDHNFAEQNFPDGEAGDLYKISIWFEFNDDNLPQGFDSVSATLDRFTTTTGLKLTRYRWNWERRAQQVPESDYTTIFDLVNAANNNGADYVTRLQTHANLDEWMRVFAYHRIMGNWDSYSFSVGQNMYLYRQPGRPAVLMPWDIDFIFGLGTGASDGLWGGQDSVVNRMYDTPTFRRSLWRTYIDAVNGPLLESNYGPVIEALRASQIQNNIGSLGAVSSIYTYNNARRSFLQGQITANDAAAFNITTSGGNNFTSTTPTTTIAGNAPFAVATITINGIAYPVTWTGFTTFSITVPLTQQSNPLVLVGLDRKGKPLPGMSDTITVTYNGAVPQPQDWVVINEIHYNPAAPQTSFIELHNRHTTTPFDLSGFQLEGVGYTFPNGAIIGANSYLVLAGSAADFAAFFGAGVPVFGEFPGRLDNDGETLRLVKPGATPAQDVRISDVRYLDRLPWPTNADGLGSSLQLIDPAQDVYRVGNWAATATNAANRYTPGAVNATKAALTAFPLLWLNEVLPNNVDSATDNTGEREPFIELYNSGTTTLDLSAFYLTDDYANLTKWKFPAGTSLPSKQFLVVWADGEPGESTPAAPHTSFRLNAASGSVALVRLQGAGNTAAVMDFADYTSLFPGRSVGLIPDGEPRGRRLVYFPTAGASNNPAIPAVNVFINEFMAQNQSTLADPADGDWDDWIELYNAGTTTVDLTGFFLTDNLTNKTAFTIPPGYPIPAGGFLLVWADNETDQNIAPNTDLHADFALSRTGEQIGLYSPDGSLVDGFSFTTQTNDISLGRFPDGADGQLVYFEEPSPREPNFIAGGNLPPTVSPIADKTVGEGSQLAFTVTATDANAGQTLKYSLGADAPGGATINDVTGAFIWTPTEAQGPGSFSFTVRATDNGTPQRTGAARVNVTVSEVNLAPVFGTIADQSVDEGAQLALTVPATDPDLPANTLIYSLEAGSPEGIILDVNTGELAWTTAENQGGQVFNVGVRVSDNGSPAQSVLKTIKVTVNEVNNPPTFVQPSQQLVNEGELLSVSLSASDPEGAQVRFSFVGGVPSGISLDPVTGVLTWTPDEADGPGNYPVVVRVTEQTPEALTVQRTFSISVSEANLPPTLAQPTDVTVEEGATVAFTATATDPDLPAQTLNYSLVGEVPVGAAIDGNTGAFAWTTPGDIGAATNTFTIRVSDNGPGNLADTKSFKVITRPRFKVVLNEIMYRPLTANAEYIELINASTTTTWDISAYELRGDNLSFMFPVDTELAPGGSVCVVRNLATFRATYGASIPVAGVWTGALGTAADNLKLVRPGPPETVVDQVQFRATAPWPTAAGGSGASLQLVDNRRDNSRVANWAAAPAYNGPRQLVVMTNQWRYFQTGAPDPNWKAADFNDATWPQGRALLYVEVADLPAPKSTPLTLGQPGYYFRTTFTLPEVPAGATLRLQHIIDDGAVVYLNGGEIYRFGFPADTVVQHESQGALVGDAMLTGPITLPADKLRVGVNVVAVEVHQTSVGSSDIVFGASLDLEGGTLPGQTPGATNNVFATLEEFPPVFLNEVLPNNSTGLADSKGEREPWIEVFNAGIAPVELSGWGLTDSYGTLNKWLFPAGTVIAPGQFLVVFGDGEPAEATGTELHTGFRINAAAGSLALSRPQGGSLAVVDYLDYTGLTANQSLASVPDGQLFIRQPSVATPGTANGGTVANRPPVLTAIGNRAIAELVVLTFNASATDPDAGQTVTFSLTGNVPAGAAITPAGAFSWTPTEPQGPGSYTFTVLATDSGVPGATDEETITVTVSEVNLAPSLAAIPPKTAFVGQTLQFTLEGSDVDLPSQELRYALTQGTVGAAVAETTGVFTWTPAANQAGTLTLSAAVNDNGSPSLRAEREFTVTVLTTAVAPSLEAELNDGGILKLTWASEIGATYRVERRDRITDAWQTLQTLTATTATSSVTDDTAGRNERYYRLVVP